VEYNIVKRKRDKHKKKEGVKDIYRRKHETKDERIQQSRKENGSK
jgi:hypothetical protein